MSRRHSVKRLRPHWYRASEDPENPEFWKNHWRDCTCRKCPTCGLTNCPDCDRDGRYCTCWYPKD